MSTTKISIPVDVTHSPATLLRAGDISAIYEQGRIRYISVNGEEVLRMIYPALRSEDWTTITGTISNEKVSIHGNSFKITYNSDYEAGEIKYKAEYSIEGFENNRIAFTMKGIALSNFRSKRIGLCILRPVEPANTEVKITRPDGSDYSSAFPELVSPRQPFRNIREMQWGEPENGKLYNLKLEGDIFETEDQRNWTDCSFKTYSRPADLPAPFDVHKGEVTDQSATLHVKIEKHGAKQKPPAAVQNKLRIPKIGYARSAQHEPLTDAQIQLLKKIPFEHYFVLININEDGWKQIFQSAVKEASRLGVKLMLNIQFRLQKEEEIDEVINEIGFAKENLISILPLSAMGTPCESEFSKKAYTKLKQSIPEILVGYGTNGNFVDVNRARPEGSEYDFISFHLQPQAHLTDSRTIIENIGSPPYVIRTINSFAPGKSIYISPITFTKRDPDERLHTWFGAWWTLGILSRLGKAERITFYEVSGKAGILYGSELSPIYQVLKTLKEFSATYIIENTGSDIVFESESGRRLIFTSDMSELGNKFS